MNEVFDRTMFLEMRNYPRDYRECLKQAVNEIMSNEELRETYTMYGLDYDQYLEDMYKAYLRHKSQRISDQWHEIN